MAGKALRSRTLGNLADSELEILTDAQVEDFNTDRGDGSNKQVDLEVLGSSDQVVLTQSRDSTEMQFSDEGATMTGSKVGTASSQIPPTDLLIMMWEAMQRDREERNKERELDERARAESEVRIEAQLCQLQENTVKRAEHVTARFQAKVDKLIDILQRKIDKVNNELSESVETLKKNFQQKFDGVDKRMNMLCESVNEKLKRQLAGTKTINDNLREDINSRTKDIVVEEISVFKDRR
jgi:hypothetical protein